jgi:hypothetical protein
MEWRKQWSIELFLTILRSRDAYPIVRNPIFSFAMFLILQFCMNWNRAELCAFDHWPFSLPTVTAPDRKRHRKLEGWEGQKKKRSEKTKEMTCNQPAGLWKKGSNLMSLHPDALNTAWPKTVRNIAFFNSNHPLAHFLVWTEIYSQERTDDITAPIDLFSDCRR